MQTVGKVLFFGRLSEIAGAGELPMPEFEGTIGAEGLVRLLSADRPELATALLAPEIRICLNLTIVPCGERVEISSADEVAFLPPMSGG